MDDFEDLENTELVKRALTMLRIKNALTYSITKDAVFGKLPAKTLMKKYKISRSFVYKRIAMGRNLLLEFINKDSISRKAMEEEDFNLKFPKVDGNRSN